MQSHTARVSRRHPGVGRAGDGARRRGHDSRASARRVEPLPARFEALERDGQRVPTRPLAEALEDEAPTGARDDAVLVAGPDATLKEVLQGRIHSHLPQVVVDGAGRLLGVISERELIHGILYKTANPDVEAAVASQATREATA